MEFRITYEGLLLSDNNRRKKHIATASHKHSIRKKIHPQIKKIWELEPSLAKTVRFEGRERGIGHEIGVLEARNSISGLSRRFKAGNFSFAPLINRGVGAVCSLNVLFLRSDGPGSVLRSGDIDNRLKTLFDGLTMPQNTDQLGDYEMPEEGEDPFFCLLEDDSLITKISVETDTMLQPVPDVDESGAARVIIQFSTKVVGDYDLRNAAYIS